jgi:hypothetical protein
MMPVVLMSGHGSVLVMFVDHIHFKMLAICTLVCGYAVEMQWFYVERGDAGA